MDTLNKRKIGSGAENLAKDFLEKKGLIFVEKNFLCSLGEVDLIMKDGEDIVFVEVRSGSQADFLTLLESVNRYKQRKIIKAASYYLKKNNLFNKVNSRFDVIGINQFQQMEWIKNAFEDFVF